MQIGWPSYNVNQYEHMVSNDGYVENLGAPCRDGLCHIKQCLPMSHFSLHHHKKSQRICALQR